MNCSKHSILLLYHLVRLVLSAALVSFTLFSPFSLAKAESIKLPLNNWASQQVLTTSIGMMLQEDGVKVDYVHMQSHKQWGALARGAVHFQVEVWSPSMKNSFAIYPKVLDAGTHSAKVREDWWYPSWVEPLCPGLPDWRALNACSRIFSTNNSEIGTYYKGPWDYDDPELIRALGLKFRIERLKNDTELWQILKQAQVNKQPIVILNWSPNWTDSKIKGAFVEFPPYSVQCETDPSYGINKNMTHDCGNPVRGWLKKAKWVGLEATYPCIDTFLETINFSNEMVIRASILGSNDNLTLPQAALQWLDEFAQEAKSWFPTQCEISAKLKSNIVSQ